MRRIGYEPLQAVLSVDTGEVRATFVMHQVSRTLAKVVVTESAVDDVKLRLDRDGFTWRSKAEPMGHFIKRADILHERTALTLGDLLAHYQIYEDDPNSFLLDDRLTDYDEIRSYPLSAVIGIELYPRQRPIEYSGLRDPRLSMMSQGSLRKHTLVVIWTYPLASVKGSSQRR